MSRNVNEPSAAHEGDGMLFTDELILRRTPKLVGLFFE